MSENPIPKSTTYLEAPASWNTRYLNPEGFVCQITLRAESGRDLLEKANVAIAYLVETGCTPCEAITIRPKSNGNGNKSQSGATSSASAVPIQW